MVFYGIPKRNRRRESWNLLRTPVNVLLRLDPIARWTRKESRRFRFENAWVGKAGSGEIMGKCLGAKQGEANLGENLDMWGGASK
ncbi:unnamed protein product [Dovyalis caffra]|uniref:Uncharacterized protein n=1 Tax=Dovyalis caffra TaxID=77055 RepID=A0AAV1RCJ8_9ROSI|nr:unnamed protein product [Dovyalis caffra]